MCVETAMLFDNQSLYLNKNGDEWPVFGNFTKGTFTSSMPGLEELQAAALDTALLGHIPDEVRERLNLDSSNPLASGVSWLAKKQLADFENWTKESVYRIATQTGLVGGAAGVVLPELFNAVGQMQDAVQMAMDPTKPVQLGKQLGDMAIAQILGAMSASGNPYVLIAAAVVSTGMQVYDVIVRSKRTNVLEVERLPFVTYVSGDTDAMLVDQVLSELDPKGPDSVRDITAMFQPAYAWTEPWDVEERGNTVLGTPAIPKPAWGFALQQKAPGEDQFTPSGALGFMPGTARMRRVLEWKSPDHWWDGRGHAASWNKIRANYQNRSCLVSEEWWDGYRNDELYNCRQNVPKGMITGGAKISDKDTYYKDGHRDHKRGPSGTPGGLLSVPRFTVTDVGDWYPNALQGLLSMWTSVMRPSPIMYSVNAEAVHDAWERSFLQLFEEDAERLWRRYHGHGWRAALAHFFSAFMVSRMDGDIAGLGTVMDWREHWPEAHTTVRGNWPKVTSFNMSNSVFNRIIKPATQELYRRQMRYYRSPMVAYLWEQQGAHWDGGARHIAYNDVGQEFIAARKWLLHSDQRFEVRMSDVVDRPYYDALMLSGVPEDNIPRVQTITMIPGGGGDGPTDPRLLDLAGEPIEDPTIPWPEGGLPGLPIASMKPKKKSSGGSGLGLVAVAAIAALALKK